jgi:glucosyl-dolichyl phosphate glucuronosyltransferase
MIPKQIKTTDHNYAGECLLTIAVCTFNRAFLLKDALRSLRVPEGNPTFEILIIDNNSSDKTQTVVQKFADEASFPVRYLVEKRLGLSRARNRAVLEANGDWIWYVDDDIAFTPNWLSEVFTGLKKFPDASVFAGRVVPSFEDSRPEWLSDSLLPYYGHTHFGDQPRWLKTTEHPVGANVGFRKNVFDQVGLFKPSLGRVGNKLLSCEETELVTRLHSAGHRVAYLPDAEVRHRVPLERAKISWLRRRAYWGGISFVMTEGSPLQSTGFGLVREAAQTVRRVTRLLYRQGGEAENQIKCAWQMGTARQCLVESARGLRNRRGKSTSALAPGASSDVYL